MKKLMMVLAVLAVFGLATAQATTTTPILVSSGWNIDFIQEVGAPVTPTSGVKLYGLDFTATGWTYYGRCLFEQGAVGRVSDPLPGTGGIPTDGVVTGVANTDHTYKLGPFEGMNTSLDYAARTFTLATPAKYSEVWYIGAATSGSQNPQVTYNYDEGSPTTTNTGNIPGEGAGASVGLTMVGDQNNFTTLWPPAGTGYTAGEDQITAGPDPTRNLVSIEIASIPSGWVWISGFSGALAAPPIAEPASLGLLGVGLLAMRRRRS